MEVTLTLILQPLPPMLIPPIPPLAAALEDGMDMAVPLGMDIPVLVGIVMLVAEAMPDMAMLMELIAILIEPIELIAML